MHIFLIAGWVLISSVQEPEIIVTKDDTIINRSCLVRIPKGLVITDEGRPGVIHITKPDITVTFVEGSVLRGSRMDAPPESYVGTGIHVGASNATVRGARVSGFKVGLRAEEAHKLTLEDSSFDDNYRQRLRSTPASEDGADWLYPHHNDKEEWTKNHGAAVHLRECTAVTLRRIKVRGGQNGLVLDRVNNSRIYDNDASFLSGWGLAMWRSSDNFVSRNAFDFCVRGYSHGVYNRGQDSAGILMFEQCCRNHFLENSATHGGDGIFGFAGQEALDGKEALGCNDNVFQDNDLSYAAAHGLEMTFSFRNRIIDNRFVGNAICGIWAGYSQFTQIQGNTFTSNGDMAYGLERGGVNIEHGYRNSIVDNTFSENACGVHLWDDADEGLLEKPWAKANHRGCRENVIARNRFSKDRVAIQLRDAKQTAISDNTMEDVGKTIESDRPVEEGDPTTPAIPEGLRPAPLGETRPVGARADLRGREHIIMMPYGPWDHAAPLVRLGSAHADRHVYELHRLPGSVATVFLEPPLFCEVSPGTDGSIMRLTVKALAPGAFPYRVPVTAGTFSTVVEGVLVNTQWSVRVFPCPDPREDPAIWKRASEGPSALQATVGHLDLKYGMGGPSDLGMSPEITAAGMKANHFGTKATTIVPLTEGTWRLVTESDDGIRVLVDGKPVIDDWTWHAPKRHEAKIELPRDRAVRIEVQHFELDGFAVLSVRLELVGG